MSLTEKLANMRYDRLVSVHIYLQARDWPEGGMYNAEINVTMDAWAQMVANEMQNRRKEKVTA